MKEKRENNWGEKKGAGLRTYARTLLFSWENRSIIRKDCQEREQMEKRAAQQKKEIRRNILGPTSKSPEISRNSHGKRSPGCE